jgi:predicted DNA-binding antitoxin AbrB/MazE fold protein
MAVVREAVYENGLLKPDQPLALGERQRVRLTIEPVTDASPTIARRELAQALVRRVESLLPFIGDVGLPAHLELLKRDLARSHQVLRAHPEDNDYLSVITLVESVLVSRSWKQYTREYLEAIRQALEVGCGPQPVSFADYERAGDLFAAAGIDTMPRVDLDALSEDDLTDGQKT